jgi:hypothetical protein
VVSPLEVSEAEAHGSPTEVMQLSISGPCLWSRRAYVYREGKGSATVLLDRPHGAPGGLSRTPHKALCLSGGLWLCSQGRVIWAEIWGAADAGDLAEVQRLVGQNARLLNAKDRHSGSTPLTFASAKGHVEVVRWLVDQGAALDERHRCGYTALGLASSQGHTPVVRLLLERGADPAITIHGARTPLVQASLRGHVATVRCLLDHPSAAATINQREYQGKTALHLAGRNGHAGVVRALLEKGADPTIADNNGTTPMAISRVCNRRACVELLEVRCSLLPLLPPRLLTGLT